MPSASVIRNTLLNEDINYGFFLEVYLYTSTATRFPFIKYDSCITKENRHHAVAKFLKYLPKEHFVNICFQVMEIP